MRDFYKLLKERRSIRVLGKQELIPRGRLEEVIGHAVRFTPTAFNAQEQKIILLLDERHNWFWALLKEKLKQVVPAEKFPATAHKIDGFSGGVGTILLYQDRAVISGLQEQFPSYTDNFPLWAHQASGMLKYTLWTSLVAEGYGASLQHYTELIEQDVNQALEVAPSWHMVGQIPFGSPQEQADHKTFEPLEERMLVFR